MNQSKISVRYAKALFISSQEKNILEEIKNDITLVYKTIKEITEFRLFLTDPITKTSKKQLIFKNAFDRKVNNLTLSFIELIVKNKREMHLEDISRNFLDLYRKEKGIKKVVFTSATKASEHTKKNISELVKNVYKSEVDLTETVNSDIIGGFILRIEDQQVDTSVSSKLEKFRRELTTSLN